MHQGMTLRAVLKKGSLDGAWIAVCLERYIVAQGNSPDDALREFKAMLAAEIIRGIERGNADQPLAGIEPAPAKYWDVFETAEPHDPPSLEVDIKLRDRPSGRKVQEIGELRLAA